MKHFATAHERTKKRRYRSRFIETGKVLKSSPIENREDQFENRIQFVNMVNDDREAIIKYIFEEERKQRHRERGTF